VVFISTVAPLINFPTFEARGYLVITSHFPEWIDGIGFVATAFNLETQQNNVRVYADNPAHVGIGTRGTLVRMTEQQADLPILGGATAHRVEVIDNALAGVETNAAIGAILPEAGLAGTSVVRDTGIVSWRHNPNGTFHLNGFNYVMPMTNVTDANGPLSLMFRNDLSVARNLPNDPNVQDQENGVNVGNLGRQTGIPLIWNTLEAASNNYGAIVWYDAWQTATENRIPLAVVFFRLPAPTQTVPTVVANGAVMTTETTVEITFSGALSTTLPAAGSFRVWAGETVNDIAAHTPTAVALVPGSPNVLRLTITAPETTNFVFVEYTRPATGGLRAAIGATAYVNTFYVQASVTPTAPVSIEITGPRTIKVRFGEVINEIPTGSANSGFSVWVNGQVQNVTSVTRTSGSPANTAVDVTWTGGLEANNLNTVEIRYTASLATVPLRITAGNVLIPDIGRTVAVTTGVDKTSAFAALTATNGRPSANPGPVPSTNLTSPNGFVIDRTSEGLGWSGMTANGDTTFGVGDVPVFKFYVAPGINQSWGADIDADDIPIANMRGGTPAGTVTHAAIEGGSTAKVLVTVTFPAIVAAVTATTVPTLQSAVISNANPNQIVMTFNTGSTIGSLVTGSGTTAAWRDRYTLNVTTDTGEGSGLDALAITGVTVGASAVTLTLNRPARAGDVMTIAYASTGETPNANRLRTTLNTGISYLPNIAATPVTVNVAIAATMVRDANEMTTAFDTLVVGWEFAADAAARIALTQDFLAAATPLLNMLEAADHSGAGVSAVTSALEGLDVNGNLNAVEAAVLPIVAAINNLVTTTGLTTAANRTALANLVEDFVVAVQNATAEKFAISWRTERFEDPTDNLVFGAAEIVSISGTNSLTEAAEGAIVTVRVTVSAINEKASGAGTLLIEKFTGNTSEDFTITSGNTTFIVVEAIEEVTREFTFVMPDKAIVDLHVVVASAGLAD